eukprot:1158649-Pelagomonas_calceolata.AAC.5
MLGKVPFTVFLPPCIPSDVKWGAWGRASPPCLLTKRAGWPTTHAPFAKELDGAPNTLPLQRAGWTQ